MKPSQDVKNILVIRSATRILNQTLTALKQEFPDAKITVLAPKSVENVVASDPLIDEVLTIADNRRMGVISYGWRQLTLLRQKNFDLAVSLYNIDHGLGYSNIDVLAWASKAKSIRGYNAKGSYVALTGKSILKKSILEKTTFIWVVLNFLATGVLFAAITLGLIGEWCLRKLFSAQKTPAKIKVIRKKKTVHETQPTGEVAKVMTQV
jgi:ADP-heptose:LPS heptosyltransferase